MRNRGVLLVLLVAAAGIPLTAQLSPDALKEITPEGYKIDQTMPCGPREYLVAFVETDGEVVNSKPVILLLVGGSKKIIVEDRVQPHDSNYFNEMSREKVDGADLLLVKSFDSGGGSGFLTYFDLYRIENKKLHLVKTFERGRMERGYFAIYKNAVYDADVVCKRGEKHGKAFVYTCYLQVTKFTYDGTAFRSVGSERLHEQQGNRFLEDKYRNMSVLKALRKGEIFAQAPR